MLPVTRFMHLLASMFKKLERVMNFLKRMGHQMNKAVKHEHGKGQEVKIGQRVRSEQSLSFVVYLTVQ